MMALFLVIALGLSGVTSALAAPIQPLSNLQSAVSEKLRTHFAERKIDVHVTVGKLDERLTLTACRGKLETFFPPGSGETNISIVGVRCNEGVAWTVYVPVDVQYNYTVVTTTRNIPKGHVVSAQDIITSQRTDRAIPADVATSLDQIIGKELLRSLPPSAIIPVNALREPIAIKRGDAVRVRIGNEDLQVLVSGIALGSGAVGDVIQVKNSRTERVLVGTVRGPGEVEVGM